MDLFVFLVVLFAAVLHATWNAIIKSSGDRVVSMALHDVVMFGICLLLVIFVAPVPSKEVFVYILASFGVLVFYRIFLLKAYQYGDFGRSYPIVRGVAPLLVAGAGFLLGDDVLSSFGYAAISLISLGIVSLIFSKKYAGDKKLDKGFFYAIATGCIIATYSVIDSRGVKLAESAVGYLAYVTLMSSSWMPAYALLARRKTFWAAFPIYYKRALISGSCAIAGFSCVLWAYTQTSAIHVVAVRETSVIFGAIIGAYILHEGLGPRRITSAALVSLGVILLQFSG